MLDTSPDDKTINNHYTQGNLSISVIDALKSSGRYHSMTEEDLTPVDQFHIGGKRSTLELAELADLTANDRILDVGGGIGGPARTLATKYNCSITVLDITEEYCKLGELLTTKTDLKDFVSFKEGSALDIPFSHQCFDVVWTQHSSMNIADKERLYTEIHRVLKTHGKLAMHEIMAGEKSPIHFPVPWARHQAISSLQRPEEIRDLIIKLGFKEITWKDETEDAISLFKNKQEEIPNLENSNKLGLHLLLGSDYRLMMENQIKNLNEHKITVIKAVFEKL